MSRNRGFEFAIGGDEPPTLRCHALVNAAGPYVPTDHPPPHRWGADGHDAAGLFLPRRPSSRCRGAPRFGALSAQSPRRAASSSHQPTIGYAVDAARGWAFYAAIRNYWPDMVDRLGRCRGQAGAAGR
jgi:hypothetical protein